MGIASISPSGRKCFLPLFTEVGGLIKVALMGGYKHRAKCDI